MATIYKYSCIWHLQLYLLFLTELFNDGTATTAAKWTLSRHRQHPSQQTAAGFSDCPAISISRILQGPKTSSKSPTRSSPIPSIQVWKMFQKQRHFPSFRCDTKVPSHLHTPDREEKLIIKGIHADSPHHPPHERSLVEPLPVLHA